MIILYVYTSFSLLRTPADESNDRTTLDRALDERLVLIVKPRSGDEWRLPESAWEVRGYVLLYILFVGTAALSLSQYDKSRASRCVSTRHTSPSLPCAQPNNPFLPHNIFAQLFIRQLPTRKCFTPLSRPVVICRQVWARGQQLTTYVVVASCWNDTAPRGTKHGVLLVFIR